MIPHSHLESQLGLKSIGVHSEQISQSEAELSGFVGILHLDFGDVSLVFVVFSGCIQSEYILDNTSQVYKKTLKTKKKMGDNKNGAK